MDGDTIQCSFHSNLIYANFDQRFNAVSLPFLFNGYDGIDAAMNGAGGKEMKSALAEYGLVCEGIGDNKARDQVRERSEGPEDPHQLV